MPSATAEPGARNLLGGRRIIKGYADFTGVNVRRVQLIISGITTLDHYLELQLRHNSVPPKLIILSQTETFQSLGVRHQNGYMLKRVEDSQQLLKYKQLLLHHQTKINMRMLPSEQIKIWL